jgi:hypothetical protein
MQNGVYSFDFYVRVYCLVFMRFVTIYKSGLLRIAQRFL